MLWDWILVFALSQAKIDVQSIKNTLPVRYSPTMNTIKRRAPVSLPNLLFHVGKDAGFIVKGPVRICRRVLCELIRILVLVSRDVHETHFDILLGMFVAELNQTFPKVTIRHVLASELYPVSLLPPSHPVGDPIDNINAVTCDVHYLPAFAAPLSTLEGSCGCTKLRAIASWVVILSSRPTSFKRKHDGPEVHVRVVWWTLSAVYNRTAGPSDIHVDTAILVQAGPVYVDEDLMVWTLEAYHT